jgi:hypothetical protein
MSAETSMDDGRNPYAGWIAGIFGVLAILAIGGVLWFTHHPL